ncbi:MAG TPA: MucB/RseB C-terminal domain-containing protein [Burkholderiales bacterium]|nr:MucB/RseB C-terminal domain-containing protein [Burkholderiales bacterium]
MRAFWPLLLLGAAAPALAVEPARPEDGLAWLKKMASASRRLNYSGVFVYQHANRTETSRIVHYVNPAGGEFERLETLDGPAREVIRTNDQVTCYLPDAKTVIIEKRNPRRFPALLPEQLNDVSENYSIRLGSLDRVAGHECQVIALEPRDRMRYGHQFCAEVISGLPLRARTLDERRMPLESFAFTEVRIGGSFNRDKVKSRYASRSQSWKIDRSEPAAFEAQPDTAWVLMQQPPGFKKLMELKRTMTGRAAVVKQIIYSDGLAAVSVFIEPLPGARPVLGLSHQGAVNIYARPVADYMVTVLGEAPAATVKQIADSLEFRGTR